MLKHLAITLCIISFFTFGCKETPTSPQETPVEKTQQQSNPQPTAINETTNEELLKDFWLNAGQPITNSEAQQLTNNYRHNVGGIQNIFISKEILEGVLNHNKSRGAIFWLGRNPEFTVVVIPADIYGRKISTSTVIGNDNKKISYAEAQKLTSNFTYSIGSIKGRMASRECVQRLLSGNNTKGIFLNIAYHTNGDFTFVLSKATNTTTFSNGDGEPIGIKEDMVPPPTEDRKD